MRALLVAVVLVVAVGCADGTGGEGAAEGVGREVSAATVRPASIAALRFASAVEQLRARPALHADFEATVGGVTTAGSLERDGATEHWRAAIGDEIIDRGDTSELDPRLGRALELAALTPLVDGLIGDGVEQTRPSRPGAYGIETGLRVRAADGGAVEYWVSEDSGLLTTLVVDDGGDSIVVRFTPLPAALVIEPRG